MISADSASKIENYKIADIVLPLLEEKFIEKFITIMRKSFGRPFC